MDKSSVGLHPVYILYYNIVVIIQSRFVVIILFTIRMLFVQVYAKCERRTTNISVTSKMRLFTAKQGLEGKKKSYKLVRIIIIVLVPYIYTVIH